MYHWCPLHFLEHFDNNQLSPMIFGRSLVYFNTVRCLTFHRWAMSSDMVVGLQENHISQRIYSSTDAVTRYYHIGQQNIHRNLVAHPNSVRRGDFRWGFSFTNWTGCSCSSPNPADNRRRLSQWRHQPRLQLISFAVPVQNSWDFLSGLYMAHVLSDPILRKYRFLLRETHLIDIMPVHHLWVLISYPASYH